MAGGAYCEFTSECLVCTTSRVGPVARAHAVTKHKVLIWGPLWLRVGLANWRMVGLTVNMLNKVQIVEHALIWPILRNTDLLFVGQIYTAGQWGISFTQTLMSILISLLIV